jgi:hypothetical protein
MVIFDDFYAHLFYDGNVLNDPSFYVYSSLRDHCDLNDRDAPLILSFFPGDVCDCPLLPQINLF